MALAYGKIPDSYEDPEVQAVNRCLTRLGYTMRPNAWKVDTFPFLRYAQSSPIVYLQLTRSLDTSRVT